MSFRAVNWALHEIRGIGSAKWVLVALAEYADDTDRAWPKRETLADVVECSRSSIARYLNQLESLGLIEREARYFYDESGRAHRGSTMYRLMVGAQPRLSESAGQPMGLKLSPIEDADDPGSEEREYLCRSVNESHHEPHGSYGAQNRGVKGSQVSPIDIKKEPPIEPPDLTSCEQARDAGRGAGVGSGFDAEAEFGEATAAVSPALAGAPSAACPAGDPFESGDSWADPVPGEPLDALEADVKRAGGSSEDDGLLVAACLPPALQALDRQGARRVAQMLRVRLDAGWAPGQIRQLMDQRLPSRVHRLAALVAARLEANVDPQAAPERLREQAERRDRERLAALRASQDRQVEALVDDVVDAEFDALVAQVQADMPDANWATWTRIAMGRRGEGGVSA